MDIINFTQLPDISDASSANARQLQLQSKSGSGLTEKQRQQARKVSQDFEALMVNMMIKSMRTTVGKDTLTGGGHGEEVFRSMLDQEYAAASVKRGGGLGLAKTIEKDIIRQESRKVTSTLDHRE
jgi:flagellar protein FlgJ